MYDYIVIGAGTAGCTIAARLSDDPAVHVLLIEAGPPNRHRAIRTPLAYPHLFRTEFDWNDSTEPQEMLGNRHLYWPRGKVLGGSGSINAMVRTLPCRADLDAWGVPGWGFDDLKFAQVGEPVSEPNPMTDAFLRACAAEGIGRKDVLADASEAACGLFRADVRKGVRHGVAERHLRPALRRGNLTVWTGVTVTRILIEGGLDSGRAVGVEYLHNGTLGHERVTREVVLCAGAVASPQLLMVSGVGPRSALERLGIEPVADLSGVGENLQDHIAAPLSYVSTQPVSLSGAETLASRTRHFLRGAGPLSSPGAEAGAFFKCGAACNLEIVFAPVHYVDHGFAKPGGHGFSLIPALLTPRSRGRVTLASTDPRVAPAIDPAYLTDPADLTALVEGVVFARKLVAQSVLASYRGESVLGDLEPAEHVRAWGQTLYHPVGTCRMGIDDAAVVDASLRVRGVVGLRVADASVIPVIPRAHPNALVEAIAEKAARLLKEA